MLMDKIREQTLKEWVEAYSDLLYTRALRKVSNTQIAEDLVQETFIAAYTSFHNFKNLSRPKTWLFAILNNKIVDHYRKKSVISMDQLTEDEGIQFTDSLFDAKGNWNSIETSSIWENENSLLDNEEFNNVLVFCLDDLPSKWSLAIKLKYLLEKDATIICQELEMTPTNFWQVIHRAKLLLRKCIEKHWKS
jgi:RNA polymerase sigma-70 factor (TIGR02943 family)